MLVLASNSLAASRYYYDVQKFKAILESREVEAKLGLSNLEGIELQSVDLERRTITYALKFDKGRCRTEVVLRFDEGAEPNYRVASVGQVSCRQDPRQRQQFP
jgi:hypothetical protein